jgi:hypothetical protein
MGHEKTVSDLAGIRAKLDMVRKEIAESQSQAVLELQPHLESAKKSISGVKKAYEKSLSNLSTRIETFRK